MPLMRKTMSNPQGCAAGQTASFDLPVGLAYHKLYLEFKHGAPLAYADEAAFKTHIKEVRLIVDGHTKIQASAEFLLMLMKYRKHNFTVGVLPIFLASEHARSTEGEDATVYGTADVDVMTLEIDFSDEVVAPKLKVTADQGPNCKLGKHIAIRRFNQSNDVAGQVELSTLPRGAYGCVAMHINRGDVTDFKVEVNNQILKEGSSAVYKAALADKRAVQDGWFHCEFTERDRMGDVLSLKLAEFRQKITFSNVGAYDLYMERVEGIAPITA